MAHQSGTALPVERAREVNCVIGSTKTGPRFTSRLFAGPPEAIVLRSVFATRVANSRSAPGAVLTFISYAYRFTSNFAFLAVVYFTLNFLTKYEERTIIAALVLAYSIMRVVSAVRQFHFYSRIERLETEASTKVSDSPGKKQAIRDVAILRHQGELKAYMDLLFLGLISILCIAKIISS